MPVDISTAELRTMLRAHPGRKRDGTARTRGEQAIRTIIRKELLPLPPWVGTLYTKFDQYIARRLCHIHAHASFGVYC